MVALYGSTLFLAAFLLFSIQPLIARLLMPLAGGAPAVWNTCVVFFQAALIAGYMWAHVITARTLRPQRQALLHLAFLGLASLFLPVPWPDRTMPPIEQGSAAALLALLPPLIGLPFVAVAATAPLLQAWFSRSTHPRAGDPFFLYAASNAGSLAALAAYPFAIEPLLTLQAQLAWWRWGYALLTVAIGACLWLVWRSPAMSASATIARSGVADIPVRDWLGWLALSAIPASLLLGTTTYLSTDVASVPLLWVAPLALYLSTFIGAFSAIGVRWRRAAARLAPIAAVTAIASILASADRPLVVVIGMHLVVLFVLSFHCHAELARSRPQADALTAFYLSVAVGGAIGGALTTLVAPLVFVDVLEYPLAICLAVFVAGGRWRAVTAGERAPGSRQWSWQDIVVPAAVGAFTVFSISVGIPGIPPGSPAGRLIAFGIPLFLCALVWPWPRRFALALALICAVWAARAPGDLTVIEKGRTFFGVHRVSEDSADALRYLVHGRTIHGIQSTKADRKDEPFGYYHRDGPMGDIARHPALQQSDARVAVLGLGAGGLATYARAGQRWEFVEINDAVVRIARNPRLFTYLADAAGDVRIVPGDARQAMARAAPGELDAIVLDVFSSDAIPVHVITREALASYMRAVSAHGLVAWHLSNRHVDLIPVVAALALEAGLSARVRIDTDLSAADLAAGHLPSTWVVMVRRDSDLGPFLQDAGWVRLPPPATPPWTDDYANLVGALRWR